MAIAYLGLGSNLGDRAVFLAKALELMKDHGIQLIKASRIIETLPVGGPTQGNYLNQVVKIETMLSLEELFVCTSAIERRLGRIRSEKNGPRVIDIDILLYEDLKLVSKDLIVPHPRMFEREFVMKPLKEIDPKRCASLLL